MKKYIKPKIKAIDLDPDQAILAVCQVAGAYFLFNGCFSSGTGVACPSEIRGVANQVDVLGRTNDAIPS